MHDTLFDSDLWEPVLEKYAAVTRLNVALFGVDEQVVLDTTHPTPIVKLFRQYAYDPGLFAECARRCLHQTGDRPAVTVAEAHGLTVVGTSFVLEGAIVGAAVAGYALAGFSHVATVQHWAKSAGVPFESLWNIARRLAPVPARRLLLHGELLQVLGDGLLRENRRTRQYEDMTVKLAAASAAKDEFLAVLSHELRTPLAAIVGWAAVMKKAGDLAQAAHAAEAIERNALLQSRMVDDLLDMTRIARGSIELDVQMLELEAVIRTALEPYSEAIEVKSLQLEFDAPDAPMTVEGDAGRLQQVFRNILSNAVKFTPSEGKVHIVLARQDGQAVVRVADTGNGISAEFLPFAFEIFRQQEQGTHRANEGIGIGLALVKRLTELHKGSVSIASPGLGRGTEVTVRLPLANGAPGPIDVPLAAATSAAPPLAGLSVLVVEDFDDARESMRALLEVLGARVSIARDGREGLEMLQQGPVPDVVLCDLLMPRLDGYELMRELGGSKAPHPPVIAVSGLGSDASRERTRRAGFVGHMQKPVREAVVVAAIGAALGPRVAPPA